MFDKYIGMNYIRYIENTKQSNEVIMTFSINIPTLSKIPSLSKTDKASILLSLATKYHPYSGFLQWARLANNAGGFNKCFDICITDIIETELLSLVDLKIYLACK